MASTQHWSMTVKTEMKTEENFTPICPLLTAAMIAKTGNPIEVVTCRKSGCALWSEFALRCSLASGR